MKKFFTSRAYRAKMLSCLMALTMLISSFGTLAFASETDTSETYEYQTDPSPTESASEDLSEDILEDIQEDVSEGFANEIFSETEELMPDSELNSEIVTIEPDDGFDSSGDAEITATDSTLDESTILNGTICGFRNRASGKFLTVHNGGTTAGTNVYQYSDNSSTYPNAQVFRLQYAGKAPNQYYYIHALNTSGENSGMRLKYSPSAASSGATSINLEISYMMPTEETDQWLIEHVGNNYYKIVNASNTDLCITAYGTSNGTSTGTGTTSAGNVYVTTYTGATNQHWQIYSGKRLVSLHSGTAINFKGTDANDITTVNEGAASPGAYYFLVDTYGDTLSNWYTSSTYVASIQTSGIINPYKAGKATITKIVTHLDGTTTTYTKSFYVTIPNGVYKLSNKYSGKYLDVWNNCGLDGTDVIQHSEISTTALNQMWKLTYIGYGYYTLRPLNMMTSGLTTYPSNFNAYITDIGGLDDYNSGSINAKWYIEYTSSGYVIKISTSNYALQPSQLSADNGISVNVGAYQSGQTRFCWNISAVASPPSGIRFYDVETGYGVTNPTEYIVVGDTSTKYKAVPYGNTDSYSVTYYSRQDTIVHANSTTGDVTAYGEGAAQIVAGKYIGGVYKTAEYTAFGIPIADGTYFIKNKQYGNCVQIDNNDEPDFSTNNAAIEVWNPNSENYQLWQITHVGNGYYKIISAKSGLAITVQSNYLNVSDIGLVQTTYTGAASQQWKISKTTSGNYKIAPRSAESTTNDWCMCSGSIPLFASEDFVNGYLVQQRYYGDDSNYEDEWILSSNSYELIFCAVSNAGHDHSSPLITSRKYLYDANYNNVKLYTGVIEPPDCMSYLKVANVFTSRSHGHLVVWSNDSKKAFSTGIILNDDNANLLALYSHAWSNMTTGSISITSADVFTNMDLVLFVGCETAYNGETGRNLPVVMVTNGATTAIGFEETIDCYEANKWTNDFYDQMIAGKTVREAVDYASENRSKSSGLKSAVICGDETYRLGN